MTDDVELFPRGTGGGEGGGEEDSPAGAGASASEVSGGGGWAAEPLASRLRPRTLDEYVGQRHLLAPGLLLRRAIEADRIQSLIFFGPPGTGKTSLAQVIAARTRARFERLNAVDANVADLRRVLAAASNRRRNTGAATLLFIDEIHRFNKSQQDVLLPDVEAGSVRLIGATTHNPFFFVNAPLVSRSQVFELRPLDEADLGALMRRAVEDSERGLGHLRIEALKDAGASEVECLVSTDDEAFTYNRQVSRLAPIQEHKMIRKAVDLHPDLTRVGA